MEDKDILKHTALIRHTGIKQNTIKKCMKGYFHSFPVKIDLGITKD